MGLILKKIFYMHFLVLELMHFDSYVTEICFQVYNFRYTIIGLENGLAPIRRQAIIWANDGLDKHSSMG